MPERYAIYYMLTAQHPLYRAGSAWLDYDAYTGKRAKPAAELAIPAELENLHSSLGAVRQYGFHATLKPPFRLRPGANAAALEAQLQNHARQARAFPCAALRVDSIGDFLALVPVESCRELQRLANGCVRSFDNFRAPPDVRELLKRKRHRLTPRQQRLLDRWGYPYVMQEYRFHLTLTGSLSETELRRYRPLLQAYFAAALQQPPQIEQLCLLLQNNYDAPFRVVATVALA